MPRTHTPGQQFEEVPDTVINLANLSDVLSANSLPQSPHTFSSQSPRSPDGAAFSASATSNNPEDDDGFLDLDTGDMSDPHSSSDTSEDEGGSVDLDMSTVPIPVAQNDDFRHWKLLLPLAILAARRVNRDFELSLAQDKEARASKIDGMRENLVPPIAPPAETPMLQQVPQDAPGAPKLDESIPDELAAYLHPIEPGSHEKVTTPNSRDPNGAGTSSQTGNRVLQLFANFPLVMPDQYALYLEVKQVGVESTTARLAVCVTVRYADTHTSEVFLTKFVKNQQDKCDTWHHLKAEGHFEVRPHNGTAYINVRIVQDDPHIEDLQGDIRVRSLALTPARMRYIARGDMLFEIPVPRTIKSALGFATFADEFTAGDTKFPTSSGTAFGSIEISKAYGGDRHIATEMLVTCNQNRIALLGFDNSITIVDATTGILIGQYGFSGRTVEHIAFPSAHSQMLVARTRGEHEVKQTVLVLNTSQLSVHEEVSLLPSLSRLTVLGDFGQNPWPEFSAACQPDGGAINFYTCKVPLATLVGRREDPETFAPDCEFELSVTTPSLQREINSGQIPTERQVEIWRKSKASEQPSRSLDDDRMILQMCVESSRLLVLTYSELQQMGPDGDIYKEHTQAIVNFVNTYMNYTITGNGVTATTVLTHLLHESSPIGISGEFIRAVLMDKNCQWFLRYDEEFNALAVAIKRTNFFAVRAILDYCARRAHDTHPAYAMAAEHSFSALSTTYPAILQHFFKKTSYIRARNLAFTKAYVTSSDERWRARLHMLLSKLTRGIIDPPKLDRSIVTLQLSDPKNIPPSMPVHREYELAWYVVPFPGLIKLGPESQFRKMAGGNLFDNPALINDNLATANHRVQEVVQLRYMGLKYFRSLYNYIDITSIILTITCLVQIKNAQSRLDETLEVAVEQFGLTPFAILAMYLHVIAETRILRRVGTIVNIIALIAQKIWDFFIVFALVVAGFTHAFAGRYDTVNDDFDEGDDRFLTLMLLFHLFTAIVMLTVLVALMTDAFSTTREEGEQVWRMQLSEALAEAEMSGQFLYGIARLLGLTRLVPFLKRAFSFRRAQYAPTFIYYAASTQDVEAFRHRVGRDSMDQDD
ncbi:hypothetical protein BGZ73_008807 [Actinomortierella ambigua]|nr:hypothetical protein BGZ73_008807 [Actinomortierella ambigua]